MRTTVQRWGNSLAVRIPKALAERSEITDGTPVELSVEEGNLVARPIRTRPTYTLEELVAGITDENRHGEWETGPDVGRERW